jgi:AmiR/NasT family two-component response regulator
MTEPRILQNFLGYRAVIVTEAPSAASQLEATLTKLGLSVTFAQIEAGSVRLGDDVLSVDQTVLFIDADINVTIEALGQDRPPQLPVIGLIGVEAPSRLKNIMRLGATATLRKPVYGGSVYSALFVGVNAFRQRRALLLQLQEQERRRHGRRFVMKAVVALMRTSGCDEDAAYERLRRESMRQRLPIEEYCERFMRVLPGAHEYTLENQGTICVEKSKIGGN